MNQANINDIELELYAVKEAIEANLKEYGILRDRAVELTYQLKGVFK